jgi:hypothetical protein
MRLETQEPTWRRFVTEDEINQQIGELVRKQKSAEQGLAAVELKLAGLAERFEKLAADLQRHLNKPPADLNIAKDEALRESLRFGPESKVNVDGLFEMLTERARLTLEIADYQRLIDRLK